MDEDFEIDDDEFDEGFDDELDENNEIDEDEEEEFIEEADTSKNPKEIPKNKRQSNYTISKFEKAAVIGSRANDLANGASPKIDLEQAKRIEDVVRIATIELEQGLLNDYQIKRIYTDGSYELWNLGELKYKN